MMLKIMARENSETYKYSVLALIESVRGVVEALADGRIPAFELAKDVNKQYLRYAPSYIVGAPAGNLPARPYTTLAVAKFLGSVWVNDAGNNIVAALNALELMQKGILDDKAIQGLKINQLLVMTRDIKKRLEQTSAVAKATQADVKKHTDQMAKLDADRHAAEQKEKEKQAELRRKETEAHKAEDEKAAKEWAEEQRVAKERAAERRLIFETKRAGLDAKIEEDKARADAAQTRDKNLSTRYAVSTMLGKLKMIVSERNAFREEIKALSRDKAVTAAERENLRQAFLAAGDWYTEQAIAFRPSVYVDVLKEARNKEAAKQKRESAQ
jgi:actin-related protein